MSTKCQRCGGRATMFLCPLCITKLTELLTDLPWLHDRLIEAAVGQTRLTDNGGRRGSRDILHGDTTVEDCAKITLARALAEGGCNAKASDLLTEVTDTLGRWVTALCEAQNLTPARGRSALVWMRHNVSLIAASEHAATIMDDVERLRRNVERVVNRPIPVRDLGPCPTWVDDTEEPCGRTLRSPAGDIDVYCRGCNTTHNVNRLLLARYTDAEKQPLTFDRLLKVNFAQPEQWQIPSRTLYEWRKTNTLPVRGYEGDQPLYCWSDARELRAENLRDAHARAGRARQRKLSKAERSEQAKRAAEARWGKDERTTA